MGKSSAINKQKEYSNLVSQECFDTRDAHVQISINKTVNKQDAVWVNVDGVCRLRVYAAKSIEVEDSRKVPLQPLFAVAAFSSVVGCGIYRIGDPGKLIAMIPPQAPVDVSADELNRSIIDRIKQETERVARLVLQALNAS